MVPHPVHATHPQVPLLLQALRRPLPTQGRAEAWRPQLGQQTTRRQRTPQTPSAHAAAGHRHPLPAVPNHDHHEGQRRTGSRHPTIARRSVSAGQRADRLPHLQPPTRQPTRRRSRTPTRTTDQPDPTTHTAPDHTPTRGRAMATTRMGAHMITNPDFLINNPRDCQCKSFLPPSVFSTLDHETQGLLSINSRRGAPKTGDCRWASVRWWGSIGSRLFGWRPGLRSVGCPVPNRCTGVETQQRSRRGGCLAMRWPGASLVFDVPCGRPTKPE